MKIVKIAVSLLLIVVLLLSVIACSTPDTPDAETEETTSDSLPDERDENEEHEENDGDKKENQTGGDDDGGNDNVNPPPVTESGKSIDIYLIAGQSNASGTSKVTNAAAAYEWAPGLKDGYSHVLYAGNSRSSKKDRDLPWQKTTLGLGIDIDSSTYIGPEAGMAKALSSYYNEETGKTAGIIKYAVGGSSLQNKTSGTPHSYGNWVSPSYAEHLDVSYVSTSATGKLYRNLLDQVKKNISELAAYGGYTDIHMKGLYWMQGCNDRAKPQEYELAFQYFAEDIRNDLSALMKEYTKSENDCGASEMPIIVGTISQTQNLTSATTENTNKQFIEMQKGLVEKVENCHVVDNSAYAITRWENNAAVVVGSDKWHWNQADALEIGENVGKCLLTILEGNDQTTQIPEPKLQIQSGTELRKFDLGDSTLWSS